MIPEKNPYNNWSGNGSTTTFDFDFYIEDETQLAVYHTNTSGVQTKLTYGTDYSIHEVQNEDGSYITFPLASSSHTVLQTDEVISLCLTLPISQENEYGKSSFLDLKSLEYSLDYLTRVCQIINRQMERSVKTQEGSSQSADELIEALQEAQINAAASATAAATSENNAKEYATTAGDEATIATQKTAEVSETYTTAMADISSSRQTALDDIDTAKSGAESAIQAGKEDATATIETGKTELASQISTGKTDLATQISTGQSDIASDISTGRTNISNDLSSSLNTFDTNFSNKSSTMQSKYEEYMSGIETNYEESMKAFDRLYKGVNLETKFASEIANYSSKYAWLDARKNAGNYNGIHIGDYFYTTISAGTVAGYSIAAQTFTCRIIGLNTYKNCGDSAIGNMIYVSADEGIDTPIKWQPTDNNNGTSSQNNPWLSSALYAVLNGVNNYTTSAYGSAAHGANASSKGIIHLLPSELQSVLKQKRMLLDSRYSSSGLLTGGTSWSWGDGGKLFAPNEIEVYGCGIRSDRCLTSGFWFPEAGLSIQFPWFANNCENRIKKTSNGSRCDWWLSAPASGDSAGVCYVGDSGLASGYSASGASVCAPLCFCI